MCSDEPNPIRRLTAADIAQAGELSTAAGWNQTNDDWARFIALAGESCFGIDSEGALAATGGAVCYSRALAWVGMVLTRPDCRGRGFATHIMRHTVEHLDARGVECVKLDATEMGHELYRRLGFQEESRVERWLRPAGSKPRAALAGFQMDRALDREAFGADRSALLGELARLEAVSISGAGYAMGRPGRLAAYFGPCVATSAEAARAFLEWHLARHGDEPVFWDIPVDNGAAVALAREYGFEPRRRLVRMRRGAGVRHDASRIYALAGFEFG